MLSAHRKASKYEWCSSGRLWIDDRLELRKLDLGAQCQVEVQCRVKVCLPNTQIGIIVVPKLSQKRMEGMAVVSLGLEWGQGLIAEDY